MLLNFSNNPLARGSPLTAQSFKLLNSPCWHPSVSNTSLSSEGTRTILFMCIPARISTNWFGALETLSGISTMGSPHTRGSSNSAIESTKLVDALSRRVSRREGAPRPAADRRQRRSEDSMRAKWASSFFDDAPASEPSPTGRGSPRSALRRDRVIEEHSAEWRGEGTRLHQRQRPSCA